MTFLQFECAKHTFDLFIGEGSQVENAGRADGCTDDKRSSRDASSPRLLPGLQTWSMEGNLSLWECFYTAGDQISSAEGEYGERLLFSLIHHTHTHTVVFSYSCGDI